MHNGSKPLLTPVGFHWQYGQPEPAAPSNYAPISVNDNLGMVPNQLVNVTVELDGIEQRPGGVARR